jgi:hypothetical protein
MLHLKLDSKLNSLPKELNFSASHSYFLTFHLTTFIAHPQMPQYKGEDTHSISLKTQNTGGEWNYALADLYIISILIRCVKIVILQEETFHVSCHRLYISTATTWGSVWSVCKVPNLQVTDPVLACDANGS